MSMTDPDTGRQGLIREPAPVNVRIDFAGGSILVEFSDTATTRAFADGGRVGEFGELLADTGRHFLDGEEERPR